MKLTRLVFPLLFCTAIFGAQNMMAQDYDDIYYNPSKPSKQKKQTQQQPDYPSADTYATQFSTASWSASDVDRYNRRYLAPVDTLMRDTALVTDGDSYTYTRRIERFHNPDVVINLGNADIVDSYYSEDQPSVVNIYVNNNAWGRSDYWSGYWNGYYSNAFNYWDPFWYTPSWSWGYYRPYWSYSPSWWGPSCWYPSYAWSWPHYHHHHWYPSWGRPATVPGVVRPHASAGRPGYSGGSYRPTGSATTPSGTTRPGNMGRGRYPSTTGNGYSAPSYSGGNNGRYTGTGTSTPSSRTSGSASSSSSRGRNAYGTSSSSSSSGRSSYSSGSSSSRGSYSSGGSSRGSYSSGSSGSRGGSSRGRR